MMLKSKGTSSPDSNNEVDVVSELLVQSAASGENGQHWLDAAHRGYALHLLRQERVRHGYVALPVWEYLADLARQAQISLDVALASFDLHAQPVVTPETASRIAQVLERIGCPIEQAVQMMRLSFAEIHGFSIKNELATVQRVASDIDELGICEEALRQVEATYPAELHAELDEMKTAFTAEYVREK